VPVTMNTTIQTVSKSEFDQLQQEYLAALEHPATREIFVAMCGSSEIAQAFTNPKGVGIAAFAKLVNLPITTVRHYVEMDLVSPFSLFGKFKFVIFNVPQIESVRQWRDLGLSLEEIVLRRRNLGEGVLLKEAMPNPIPSLEDQHDQAIVQVMRIQNPEERAKAHQEFEDRRKRGEPGIVLYKHETVPKIPGAMSEINTIQTELQLEYGSAIQKLEVKKLELEKRIARAKLIHEKLSQKPVS
jgi:DNA-binding transcriptional MerR regulator